MKILLRKELRELVEPPDGLAVSIYMPTNHLGDTLQGPIRLNNLMREAERKLVEAGQRRTVAHDLLEPIHALQTDAEFWRRQGDGLALFVAPKLFRYYRLPFRCPELSEVAPLFHIRPLIQLFSGSDRIFYVLALSQNSVRLLQCTRDSLRVVTPESAPTSLAQYMRVDSQQRVVSFHAAGTAGPSDRRAALVVHSQGGGSELWGKDNIVRFFTAVDRALREFLQAEQAPLVIAGVDYLHPLYRQANKYAHLLSKGIEGNTDEYTTKMLQQKGWAVVQPYFDEERTKARRMFVNLEGSNQTATGIERVAIEARDGHVFKLFVDRDAHQWGAFDPEQRMATLHSRPEPGDRDLIDVTTVWALLTGATVFTEPAPDVPGGAAIAAVLRYAEPAVFPGEDAEPAEVKTPQ